MNLSVNKLYYNLSILILIFISDISHAQTCLSGDCKNGKGTMDYGDGLQYSGYFSNGLANGEGILIDRKLKYSYSGQFKNDLLPVGVVKGENGYQYEGELDKDFNNHGNGKQIYANGDTFLGKWDKGYYVNGVYTFKDGRKYEGEIKNYKWHGHGIFYYTNGDFFDGEWFEGDKVEGTYTFEDGRKYVGTMKDNEEGKNRWNGKGKFYYTSGDVYDGDWVMGERTGKCVYTFNDGRKYEGEVSDGKWNGQGKFHYNNGDVYDGKWVNGDKVEGTYTFKDGRKYVGTIQENEEGKNRWNGKGKFYYIDGDVYDGDWVLGEQTGSCVYTFNDGRKYEGEILNGKWNGKGKFTYKKDEYYDGEWKDGRQINGVYSWPNGMKYEGKFYGNNASGKGKLTKGDIVLYDGYFDGESKTGSVWLFTVYGEFTRLLDTKTQVIATLYSNGDYYVGQHYVKNPYDYFDYTSEWEREGDGVMVYASGKTIIGKWKKGTLTTTSQELPFAPSETELYFKYAEALRAWKAHTFSEEYYTFTLKKDPKHLLALVRRAYTRTQLKKNTEALADYTAALAIEAKNAEALEGRSFVHFENKNYQKAWDDANQLAKSSPDVVGGYWMRGRAALELKKYSDAIKDLDKTLTIQTADNGNVYYFRGLAYEGNGDTEKACADFKTAKEKGSKEAIAKVSACQ